VGQGVYAPALDTEKERSEKGSSPGAEGEEEQRRNRPYNCQQQNCNKKKINTGLKLSKVSIIDPHKIRCLYSNANSLKGKMQELKMRNSTDNYHITGIVEMWASEEIKDYELKIDGYEMFRKDRIFGKGGGIIVYVKETLKSTLCNDLMNTGFEESVWCNVGTGECNLLVGVCYRCPSSSQANNEKLLQLIESASLKKNVTNVLVMGDFNYPEINYENGMVDAGSDSAPSKFFEKTQDMYWTQYVTEATRMRGIDDPSILD
jgi:hypothetical protein